MTDDEVVVVVAALTGCAGRGGATCCPGVDGIASLFAIEVDGPASCHLTTLRWEDVEGALSSPEGPGV